MNKFKEFFGRIAYHKPSIANILFVLGTMGGLITILTADGSIWGSTFWTLCRGIFSLFFLATFLVSVQVSGWKKRLPEYKIDQFEKDWERWSNQISSQMGSSLQRVLKTAREKKETKELELWAKDFVKILVSTKKGDEAKRAEEIFLKSWPPLE